MFWESFWPQFVATIFGAGLGVWGALLLDRRQEKQKREEEEQEEIKRKNKIISALRDELEVTNSELLEYKADLENSSKKESIELTLIRDETWQAFKAGGELEWIKDPILVNKFAEVYFLIKKVNFTSERFFEIVMKEPINLIAAENQVKGLIVGIAKVLEKIDKLLKSI